MTVQKKLENNLVTEKFGNEVILYPIYSLLKSIDVRQRRT